MYKFRFNEPFPCTAMETYDATTSNFEPLVKYIPNVTKIKITSQEKMEDGSTRMMVKFHGDGAIPLIARSVIKPEMLRWDEEMICNPEDMTIKWTVKAAHFSEHVHCGGLTRNVQNGNGSEVVLEGYLDITLSHLPGLPDGLVRKAVEMVEPFIGKLITPNLKKFYQAVKKNMADKK